MRLALYQPDIPQNAGAMIRLAACLGVPLDIIGPCGFPLGAREVRRVAMDYGAAADVVRHETFEAFRRAQGAGRLVLLTTAGDTPLAGFAFRPGDTLLLGRESAGAPEAIHRAADVRLRLPMAEGARSYNVAAAAALAMGAALAGRGTEPAAGALAEAAS